MQAPVILAWVLWLPLRPAPVITAMGANTLGAYLMQGYVGAFCSLAGLTVAGISGHKLFSDASACLFALIAPLLGTLLLCSDFVAFAFWQLLNPAGWGALKIFDPSAPPGTPPAAHTRAGWRVWLLVFVGASCLCAAAQAGQWTI